MNLNNPSLLLQTLLSIFARFAGVGLNFAVAFIITRNLPVGEAGMIFMLMTLVTGISLFSRLGLEQWIVRDVAGLPEETLHSTQAAHLLSAYKLLALSSIVFIGLWLLSSQLLKSVLFDGEVQIGLLWIAALGIFCFNLVMIHSAFMKAAHKVTESLLIQNALPAISMLLMTGLFWAIFTQNQNYLWVYIVSLALAGGVSFLWVRPWWGELRFQPAFYSARAVLEKSLPLAPVSFFAFLMLWTDTLMTGALMKNEDVALYTVAARLAFVSGFFLGALDATFYPRLLKVHKQDPDRLKKLFWQASGLVLLILGTVTLVLALLGSHLLAFFGAVYVQAAWALLLLLLAQLIRGLSLTFSFMFIIQERVKILNTLLFLALLVNIAANLFLIPQYGIEGAASATLLANLALTGGVVLLFFHKRLLGNYN